MQDVREAYQPERIWCVCFSDKQEPCNRFVTEEELEAEVQREYNKLGRYTGD